MQLSRTITVSLLLLSSCQKPPPVPPQDLVERGKALFFNETFNGNGRTCGTCHPAENNFTIDPAFIATLPDDDPLFVAEFNPALKKHFENPRLLREFGLILENLDGFDDLDSTFTMRGVPHTLSLGTSIESPGGPRTGWSGDGAPGDGSLRSFATGAVIQHFTKTMNRVPGVDFRLPTDEELDALEAFQLSLGRQKDLTLPLPLKGTVAKRGQAIFLDNTLGKCNICHQNAGATVFLNGQSLGNANFNTGNEIVEDQPARLTDELVPFDDGFQIPGDTTFNVPPLVEAAETGPFFHNNSVETIEGAVAFYDGEAFNNSPAGRFLASIDPEGKGIALDATQIVAIAAFLRVINSQEDIRQSSNLLKACLNKKMKNEKVAELLEQASQEIKDAKSVLSGGGLHPKAVIHLEKSNRLIRQAIDKNSSSKLINKAIEEQELASAELVETP